MIIDGLRVNYSVQVTAGTQSLSLRPIPPPLTAAVVDIPPHSAGQAVLPSCVIRCHRRVPIPSKHSHACVPPLHDDTQFLYLRRYFLPKGFGRISSQLIPIDQGVFL